MKFYSDEPNLHIIRQRLIGNRTEHFELCLFDGNCELETEDKEVIRQLINIYRHEEIEEKPEVKMKHCKKCDFTCENQGELIRHYKTMHPKK